MLEWCRATVQNHGILDLAGYEYILSNALDVVKVLLSLSLRLKLLRCKAIHDEVSSTMAEIFWKHLAIFTAENVLYSRLPVLYLEYILLLYLCRGICLVVYKTRLCSDRPNNQNSFSELV